MTLKPPIEDKGRAIWRALAETGVGMLPVVGPITRVFQTTHPSQFQVALEQWHGDVTATVNELDARVASLEAAHEPRLVLSERSIDIAVWLAGRPGAEQPYPVAMEEIHQAFSSQPSDLVEEAVHELEHAGLVTVTPVIGGGGSRVRSLWPLIWLFQPLANGVSPMADAGVLAKLALEQGDLSAPEILETLGWEPHRVNAALELVATFVPEGLVRRPSHPVFTVFGLSIDSQARMRLRQFIGGADAGSGASGT